MPDPTQDPDFLAAPAAEQHAYLMETDPDYAKASASDQKEYLRSINNPNPEAMLAQSHVQARQALATPIANARNKYESVGGYNNAQTVGAGDVPAGRAKIAQTMEPVNKGIGYGAGAAGFLLPGADAATIPGMMAPVARAAVGGIGGAYVGHGIGQSLGGDVGGEIGKFAGGLYGGGMAAGLERDPYTGKVGNLPGGIQKFIPDWLFPRKIPQAELDQAAFLNRGYKSMAEAPVDPYAPASTSATGPAPLRPLIGTPEDWNAFDQKMGVLQKEASTTGTYHAARGATGKRFNLQQRLGKAFDPYSNTR